MLLQSKWDRSTLGPEITGSKVNEMNVRKPGSVSKGSDHTSDNSDVKDLNTADATVLQDNEVLDGDDPHSAEKLNRLRRR